MLKKIFIKNKILTPKFIIFKYNLDNIIFLKEIKKNLNFLTIKPINEGSSVDVYISTNQNLRSNEQIKKYREILIEEFIGGGNQAAILEKVRSYRT